MCSDLTNTQCSKDAKGNTALSIALDVQDLESVKFLVEEMHSCSVEDINHEEFSVYSLMCSRGRMGKMSKKEKEFYDYVCENLIREQKPSKSRMTKELEALRIF